MKQERKNFSYLTATTILFFLVLGTLSIRPLRDYDIWFHVKSGEVLMQKGFIQYDVFSHTAAGRRWYPYEWLFQVSMYGVQQAWGFEAIKYVTAAIILVMLVGLWAILRRFAKAPPGIAFVSIFFFFVSIYEFFSARPHVPAYTLFIWHLYLLLLWTNEGVNRLYLTLPILWIWGNFHGSMFLGVLLFPAYAVVNGLSYYTSKNKVFIKRMITLLLWTPVALLITILPPIRTIQYDLLWEFYKNLGLIRKFIDEWTPLSTNPYAFIFYSVSTIIILVGFVFTLIRHKKEIAQYYWTIPLLPLPFIAYTASRNIFFGYLTLTILLTLCVVSLWKEYTSSRIRWTIIGLGVLFILAHIWILSQKRIPERMYFPVHAAQFIKTYDLKGNMFNEYGYGGYLLYQLYPEHKVFFDGRTDVYLCCEIQETLNLSLKKQLPDSEYKKLLDTLWDKHDISYVLFRTQKHSVLRKIGHILTSDPQWSLVFWDDDSELFIRHDGKNDALLERFGATSATPYERNPFREGHDQEAVREYTDMLKVVDSARSRNAIGYSLMKQGNLDEAKSQFEKALTLDPTFESPYMNIAELAVNAGDSVTAINFYKTAVRLAPDRGLAWLRLAQLTLKYSGDRAEAIGLLQKGIANTVDEDARAQLKQLQESID